MRLRKYYNDNSHIQLIFIFSREENCNAYSC